MTDLQTVDLSPLLVGCFAAYGIGALVLLVTWIILIVKGFNTNVPWGLVVLLLGSLGAFIYGIANFSRSGGAFIAHIVGLGLLFGATFVASSSEDFQKLLEDMQQEAETSAEALPEPRHTFLRNVS